jgi:hypothetical protein
LESFTCQNDGENIKIYEGLVEGKIIASEDISSFDYLKLLDLVKS